MLNPMPVQPRKLEPSLQTRSGVPLLCYLGLQTSLLPVQYLSKHGECINLSITTAIRAF